MMSAENFPEIMRQKETARCRSTR